MSEYPFLKIYSCSENVTNVNYVDIDYTAASLFNIPTITVVTNTNVNTYISNVTITTARINFSSKFTGSVQYTVMSNK
jgi:hypothetical protein